MKNETKFFSKNVYEDLKRGLSSNLSHKVRDLTTINLQNDFSVVIAVDSDGGIGSLPDDVIKCSNYTLGRFAMRVPLMEVLTSGAVPLAAFDMLTVPMKKYGEEIIRGIKSELKSAGLREDFPLSGSTEDNIPTTMTGIGTLVLGIVHKDDFRPGSSRKGDVVLCIGKPKSGPEDEVTLEDEEIIQQSQLRDILKTADVHDVLPVGSRGILYEAKQIAELAGLLFVPEEKHNLNMKKSAGPSTCVLISGDPSLEKKLTEIVSAPIIKIGKLSDD